MTRCIGYGGSSPPRMRGSATGVKPGCVASSMPVTPTGRCAPPGTQRRRYGHLRDRESGLALRYTLQLADDLQDESCPPEINKLGRTIGRWTPQITNWHISKVTNGPTEALNNLIKRIKRAAFGFRNFANLPNTGPSLRRETQLGPTRDRHSPLKRDEPVYRRL